jgi:hypothetical protein
VCKSANFHRTALHHIQKYISEDIAKTIACSMIDGRLDDCNSVLYQTAAKINKSSITSAKLCCAHCDKIESFQPHNSCSC